MIYGLSVAVFLLCVASFYRPGYGFTGLIEFGDHFPVGSIAGLHCFVEPKSIGYDGQFYAKLALDPLILHPSRDAHEVDDLYYRSRRIFSCWTAWALGLGRPAWIVQAYALQNAVCWLVLAWVLVRWFPPLDFNNYVRWTGILFSFGLTHSVRGSLTDGPSLLFVTLGMAFCERNRGTWAAGMFGIAGLTRETSLLAFAALIDPAKRSLRDFGKLALQGVLAFAPLVCWMVYLKLHLDHPTGVTGTGNIGFPFAGWLQKWVEILSGLARNRFARLTFPVQLALTAQVFFFFARPFVSKPAWRMGMAFAVLTLCLGVAVWQGLPGAASRTVLPMLLAFNLLVPRGRWWLALLVAGNLSVAAQPLIELRFPGDAGIVDVSDAGVDADGRRLTIGFSPEWYKSERDILQSWRRWSPGPAVVTIDNPHAFAVEADLCMVMGVTGNDNRAMSVQLNGHNIWTGVLAGRGNVVHTQSLHLEPGENLLMFNTAAAPPAANGARRLAFCLSELYVEIPSAPKP